MNPNVIRVGFLVTGCPDGFRLWFDNEPVADFPTWDAAVDARRTAMESQAMLAAALANPQRRSA